MSMQEPAQEPRRTPIRRTVPVLRVEQITPQMRRVTFAGPEMEGFSLAGPAEKMKIYFPLPGQEKPIVPDFGVRPIEGQPRPIGRTYTPRAWRPDSLQIDIDFVLHGDGPGAIWAREAEPGRFATLSSPTGTFLLDAPVERYVLGGDDAAVPAVSTILEALPASARADVYLEVDNAAEEQQIASRADVRITWLHRGKDRPGKQLEAAMGAAALPQGVRVFVASEAVAMRNIKRFLIGEGGLDRDQVYCQGYWKYGEANHSDNDKGDDV
jgi:NADPH-dependent ferric siderophore reductase